MLLHEPFGLFGPLNWLDLLFFLRAFRKSWKNLSAHNRLHLARGFSIFIGGFGGVCLGFYFFHLEETPFTHRTRFMPISHKQMEELTAMEHKNVLEKYAKYILPPNHPSHVRVFRVAKQLVMANHSKEMEHLSWQVNVVDNEDMNAFVLPVSYSAISSRELANTKCTIADQSFYCF